MRYYFAPMEGLTDIIYRNLHHTYFPGIDRYYTPFFSPTIHRSLTVKEARELPPADSLNYEVIPQILTKVPEDFQWLAERCKEQGYNEVNINLGCPSGTVTAKGKGAGMLADTDALARFLDTVFNQSSVSISVKTRLGMKEFDEFYEILEVFNRYPICELIIHPRVRSQFYDGVPNMELFEYAIQNSKSKLCYNGNLCSVTQIDDFNKKYPQVDAVMLGRALIGDPGMLSPGGTTPKVLAEFNDALLEEYTRIFGSARNAMFRMKENWRHLLCKFENSEKLGKQLRKTTSIDEFRSIASQIIYTLPMRTSLLPDW